MAGNRWEKFSDQPALQIAVDVYSGKLWIVPVSAPDQVWASDDNGVSWRRDDEGLQGPVVAPLYYNYIFMPVLNTVTLRDGRYVIWERRDVGEYGDDLWHEVATIPGRAVAYTPGGVPAGIRVLFNGGFTEYWAGSTDGKLYRWIPPMEIAPGDIAPGRWEAMVDFGAGFYPWPVGNSTAPLQYNIVPSALTVLDLNTGAMQLFMPAESQEEPYPVTWQPVAFPRPDLPWGALVLPDGEVPQRLYGQDAFAIMALTRRGALYAREIDPESMQAAWQPITAAPARTEFLVTNNSFDSIGPLYSGAELTWDGGGCTANENGFYRSDDKGVTWTKLGLGTARQPVAGLLGDPDLLLAATCMGPSISTDGGQTGVNRRRSGGRLGRARHISPYARASRRRAVCRPGAACTRPARKRRRAASSTGRPMIRPPGASARGRTSPRPA